MYLIKNNELSYDTYMNNFLQTVSKNSYYMNYGLWDNPSITDLRAANERLVDFMFEKMQPYKTPGMKILDIGCGYGEQDFALLKKIGDPTAHITAIDISETQIKFARERASAEHKQLKQLKQLNFKVGNALTIHETYKTTPFDIIISLESAFHYAERPQFFKQVNQILKPDGVFIICDMMIKNDITPSLVDSFFYTFFIKLFMDAFHVPKKNLITAAEWEHDLVLAGFEVVECNDVTAFTFLPMYDFFCTKLFQEKNLPGFLLNPLLNLFHAYQPFAYRVATCKRKATR